jgi:hypothetical protein
MSEKVIVRLFFAQSCGGGCACGPDKDVLALERAAKNLVKKFGAERLGFEAYPGFNLEQFPFLRKVAGSDGKLMLPFISVDETVLDPGSFPSYLELETEVAKRLKVI